MNYHNSYTGSVKKKILLRVLVVLVSLIVISALTLAYGNYLKSKAEGTAGSDYSGAGRTHSSDVDGQESEITTSFSKSVEVKSACIVPDSFADEAAQSEAVSAYSDNKYTGITVVLTGRDGYLTYASDAVSSFTKQKSPASKKLDFITSAVSKAHALSMRASAVIFTSEDFSENEKEIKSRVGYVSGGADYYVTKKLKTITAVTKRFYENFDDTAYRGYLEKFNLDENKTVKALSQGMKVKYSLALALSHNADLLILDEPTSGLDPVSREDLLDVFLSLKDDGKTILFSTHVTSDLDKCADDITYIRNGKIFASEPTDTFKEKYKLAFVKKDAFTDDIAACSHGIRRLKDGLSVLISADKADVLNIETTDASLEDIMVHLEKEEL